MMLSQVANYRQKIVTTMLLSKQINTSSLSCFGTKHVEKNTKNIAMVLLNVAKISDVNKIHSIMQSIS